MGEDVSKEKPLISPKAWRIIFIVGVIAMSVTMAIMNSYIINYSKILDPEKDPLQTALGIRFKHGEVECTVRVGSFDNSYFVTKDRFGKVEGGLVEYNEG